MEAQTSERYHHGDLRQALIEATTALIAERGVDGFSLREVARRAGVSAAAPAHHFGDTRGLLTAVAVLAFDDLAAAMEAAIASAGDDAGARRIALGESYVRFALANRARFDLMFRKTLLDREDAALKAAGEHCFAILGRTIGGDPHKDESVEAAAIAAWSLAHGLARLKIDGALIEPGDPDFVPRVLRTLRI